MLNPLFSYDEKVGQRRKHRIFKIQEGALWDASPL